MFEQHAELLQWKKELMISKEEKWLRLNDLKNKIKALSFRVAFSADLNDRLQSYLLSKMNEELQALKDEQKQIKLEIEDVETILYSINIELGSFIVVD